MSISKYLQKLKFKLFNRSDKKVIEKLKTGLLIPTEPPRYASHIGVDIDDTIEELIKFNRKLNDKITLAPIHTKRKSTLEWWTINEPDDSKFESRVHLLKDLLLSAMVMIDTPGDGVYYRTNKTVMDEVYPKLLAEYLFITLLESYSN